MGKTNEGNKREVQRKLISTRYIDYCYYTFMIAIQVIGLHLTYQSQAWFAFGVIVCLTLLLIFLFIIQERNKRKTKTQLDEWKRKLEKLYEEEA